MHCPQCSTQINDPQADYCPRCGIRLSRAVVQPAIPIVEPTSRAVWLPPPPAIGTRPIPGSSVPDRSRPVKILAAALLGAMILAWVMGVTLHLAALPEVTMHAVDNEVATKVKGQTGTYTDILNQTLNQIFAATWGWAFVGLVLGAGVGWYLTRPKAL